MMSTAKTKIIRDFIYIDQDRLYSFYSQLNKGIAQHIFQSFVHGESATATQTNPEFTDEIMESQRSKASERTESTILYDYMYEQLEEKLRNVIVDVSQILEGKSNDEIKPDDLRYYLETLRNALMIRVAGSVEIEDYDRIDAFIGKANQIMETIAQFHSRSEENITLINALEEEVRNEKDRNKKAQLNERIKKLKTPKLLAQELNLLDDPELIKGIRLILEVFYGKNFEISINSGTPPYSTFRGIINRDWLRIKPEILRSLYSGAVESSWTMVGQVTSTSLQNFENLDALNVGLTENLPKSKSLRDPLRYLSNRVRAFEAILNQSALRFEPIVCPLAIYRELKIPELNE